MEGSRIGVIRRGENAGLGHVCHPRKYKNLVDLWKGYNRGRERIRFGKIILMVRARPEVQRCVQWRWTEG